MQQLTLSEVRYVLRGIREEFLNNTQLHADNPLETAKLFGLYTEHLHKAPTSEESHAVIVAALQKAAKFWEYWFINPENAYRFLSEEERRVREICDRMAMAYISK